MTGPRFALIGAGWVARAVWAPLLLECGASIHAVVDPCPAAREAARILLPRARLLDGLDERIRADCDVAWICSPNALHTHQATTALRMGMDVVVEKPVCFSLDDAQILIDCALQAGRRIRSTAASSHRSDVAQLVDTVRGGSLGTVICVDVSWRRRSGVPRPGSWFTRNSSAVGGSGADLGWHLLEVALGVLDHPMIESGLWQHARPSPSDPAAAAQWRADTLGSDPGAIDVDTQTFGCLKTVSGTVVRLATAWCSHQALDETDVTVYGSNGELALRCTFGFSDNRRPEATLELRRKGAVTLLATHDEPRDAPYRSFVRSLMADLSGPRDPGGPSEQAEHRKLRSLSAAMGTLYPPRDRATPHAGEPHATPRQREGHVAHRNQEPSSV